MEQLTAAMRIHLSNSSARDELARFLAAGGFGLDIRGSTMHVGTGAKRDRRYSTFSCSLRDAIAFGRAIQNGRPSCTTYLKLTVTGAQTFRKSQLTRFCD
jgi:hypothetical protein